MFPIISEVCYRGNEKENLDLYAENLTSIH